MLSDDRAGEKWERKGIDYQTCSDDSLVSVPNFCWPLKQIHLASNTNFNLLPHFIIWIHLLHETFLSLHRETLREKINGFRVGMLSSDQIQKEFKCLDADGGELWSCTDVTSSWKEPKVDQEWCGCSMMKKVVEKWEMSEMNESKLQSMIVILKLIIEGGGKRSGGMRERVRVSIWSKGWTQTRCCTFFYFSQNFSVTFLVKRYLPLFLTLSHKYLSF